MKTTMISMVLSFTNSHKQDGRKSERRVLCLYNGEKGSGISRSLTWKHFVVAVHVGTSLKWSIVVWQSVIDSRPTALSQRPVLTMKLSWLRKLDLMSHVQACGQTVYHHPRTRCLHLLLFQQFLLASFPICLFSADSINRLSCSVYPPG